MRHWFWIGLLGSGLNTATAATDEQLAMALLLFPQAREWQAISSLPVVDDNWLDNNGWLLRKHLLEQLPAADSLESPDCSFINRALLEEHPRATIRRLDLDTDGTADLLYSGSAYCREGELTVFWKSDPRGFPNGLVTQRADELLFAKPAKAPQLLTLRSGCCGDPMDRYELAHEQAWVPKHLQGGGDPLPTRHWITALGHLTLRLAPQLDNHYNPDLSQFYNAAAFGNISRLYMPGAQVFPLKSLRDAQGQEWKLIRVEEGSAPLSVHAPLPANVGWVEARCLTEQCPPPALTP